MGKSYGCSGDGIFSAVGCGDAAEVLALVCDVLGVDGAVLESQI
jgi:hypothetical protein